MGHKQRSPDDEISHDDYDDIYYHVLYLTMSTLRSWNDAAPEIAVGMAGAPGRQASSINSDGSIKLDGPLVLFESDFC